MKKILLVSLVGLLLVALAVPTVALKFKDVPDTHWAADYVYNLVNRGIITGFPDGTYRGNMSVTRYQAAVMLDKLAKSIGTGGVSEDKLRDLIKSELAKSAAGKAEGWSIGGYYQVRGLLNKVIGDGNRTIAGQYRVVMDIAKDLGPDTGFEIGLDTKTNAGNLAFGNYDIVANGLLDLAAHTTIDDFGFPITINLSQGNGDQYHNEDMIQMTTEMYGMTVGGAYEYNNGLIANASEQYSMIGAFSTELPWLGESSISGSIDLYQPVGVANPLASGGKKQANVKGVAMPADGVKVGGKLGINGSNSNALYVAAMLTLDDIWNTGTMLYLEGYKLGGQWQTALGEDYVGTQVFDEVLITGAGGYIGALLDQKVTDNLDFAGRLALNFTGTGLGTLQTTWIEPKLSLQSSDLVSVYGAYRLMLNNVTNGKTDRLELGAIVTY
ncbi:MAG: S-layer homology domain-containing protein [Candidatus Margulisbacteria bacterium]|nr:S-layer homology domain-containing protein [Candidatus Margulisiibacteriota bacterium]MBU1021352.1 S-layer homology domain-containing protein [Candidatus Margulisiibacteriota bacterium]MBU1729159.1 S-layer homology domain-containing protein [Candidatus Margulisiibacteriota bacterium]MBU1954832.1 S-layer homology domain-containing protein [Candidatus Margulisiibacteriota bacterium]